MARYLVEWSETVRKQAVILAPPNDDEVLRAARETVVDASSAGYTEVVPEVIFWARADGADKPVTDSHGCRHIEVTISKIAEVKSGQPERVL